MSATDKKQPNLPACIRNLELVELRGQKDDLLQVVDVGVDARGVVAGIFIQTRPGGYQRAQPLAGVRQLAAAEFALHTFDRKEDHLGQVANVGGEAAVDVALHPVDQLDRLAAIVLQLFGVGGKVPAVLAQRHDLQNAQVNTSSRLGRARLSGGNLPRGVTTSVARCPEQ